MKRLESHRQKTIKRNLFFVVVIFILLIYFIFTYGIKILLATSAFIANTFSKNKNENYSIKKDDFYGTVDIDLIPDATNSASILISGRASNYDTVQVYLNDKKVEEREVSDNFNIEINNLTEGENVVYLIAKSTKDKSTKKSDNYTVIYKKDKPNLEITSPKNDEKTNKDEIKVVGKTDKEVIIEINNMPVVVNTLGEFQNSVKLQSGENKIIITAQDIAGNIETKEIKVIYEKD